MPHHTHPQHSRPLHLLHKGEKARIVHIQAQHTFGSQDEQVTQRLKELGFLPGAELQVMGFGLFGRDPVAVRINGTKFGLRRDEAAKILTQPLPSPHSAA